MSMWIRSLPFKISQAHLNGPLESAKAFLIRRLQTRAKHSQRLLY